MAKLRERYANALLEISREKGSLEIDVEAAVLIRNTLDSAEVRGFIVHPHIPDSEKYKLFNTAFAGRLSWHMSGFLNLMVKKNRERLIVPSLTQFIEIANRQMGKVTAKVVSAAELTKEQARSIHTLLTKQTGMQIELTAAVDPDVIGGFYVLVDGQIFDGTVRTELKTMKERLKRGSY